MKTRKLGNQGLEVSTMGFGCMNMSLLPDIDDPDVRKEKIGIIRKAYELGVTFFDTAEVYGNQHNEALVGEALKPIRDKITLCSKCGLKLVDGKQVVDSRREGIRESIEGSLKRLQTDHIDLYYVHRVDPKIPIEEVAETMLQLKQEGKIRFWGLSEPGMQSIRRAHKVFPLTAIESEYSMLHRDPEQDLLPTLEELGIGLVPWAPLAKGFLTSDNNGWYTQFKGTKTRFSEENMKHNQELREMLFDFAAKKNITAAQFALAWLTNQKPWIVPIPGSTKVERMEENVAAGDIEFTADEMKEVNAILDQFVIAGTRYEKGSDLEKRAGV